MAGAAIGVLTLGMGVGIALGRTDAPPAPAASQDRVAVYFSPDGGTADAMVAMLRSAGKSIRVAAYTFTDNRIADAMVEAHERGVLVEVVMDKHQAGIGGSERDRLRDAGVGVWIAPDCLIF